MRLPAARGGTPRRTESGETPAWQGARSAHIGHMQATSNAVQAGWIAGRMQRGLRRGLPGFLAAALLTAGCQAGLNAGSDASALNLELGAAYLAQGRPELARDKLLLATQQDPRSPEAHRVLGMTYESLEDHERAERHYRRAVRLAPRDVEALNSLGVFQCRRAGKPQEGLKLLERAAREAVGIRRAAVYANCGVCELPLDRNSAAEWFRRALALDPHNVEAQLLLERLES